MTYQDLEKLELALSSLANNFSKKLEHTDRASSSPVEELRYHCYVQLLSILETKSPKSLSGVEVSWWRKPLTGPTTSSPIFILRISSGSGQTVTYRFSSSTELWKSTISGSKLESTCLFQPENLSATPLKEK